MEIINTDWKFICPRYGVGYHMTIVKGTEFNESETVKLVNNTIPSAKMVGNIGAEMSYILEESSTKLFKGLFEQLEGITSVVNLLPYDFPEIFFSQV